MIDLQNSGYSKSLEDNVWTCNEKRHDFTYSDGDEVENRIYDIIVNSCDKSIFSKELASKITDWPSLYHLSPRRANLLRPILDLIQGDVLEVGAGCGAITRFLGEAERPVIALEGSYTRARIAAQRCLDLPTVDVVADNFDQLKLDKKFDTILAIGVLEYARLYFRTDNDDDPCDAFLAHAHRFLNPGGRLILAIENQLGLKYFAGFPEDHTGEPFFGIDDRYASNGVVTFGRKELKLKLKRQGFEDQQWWFPFPDYKLPLSIVAETALCDEINFDAGTLCARSVLADPQRPNFSLFSQQRAWPLIGRNGLLADVANSFLIIASSNPIRVSENIAFHFGFERRAEFAKMVLFKSTAEGIKATRVSTSPAQITHQNGRVTLHLDDEAYINGELWHDRLIKILLQRAWTNSDVVSWAKVWWDAVIEFTHLPEAGKNITVFSLLSGRHIDAIPRNMIYREGECTFIDQEWEISNRIEVGFLIFRALSDAFHMLELCSEPAADVSLTVDQLIIDTAYGLGFWLSRDDIRRYKDFENQFQEYAAGGAPHLAAHSFGGTTLPVRMRLEHLDALNASLTQSRAELDGLRRALAAQEAEAKSAHEEALREKEDLGQQFVAADTERDAIRAAHEQTAAELQAAQLRLAESQSASATLTARQQQLEAALDAAIGERDTLSQNLAAAAQDLAEQAAAAAEHLVRAEQAEHAHGEARRGKEDIAQQFAAAVTERDAIRAAHERTAAELQAARLRLAESQSASATLAARQQQLEAALDAAKGERDTLSQDLAASAQDLAAARQATADTEQHYAGARAALEAMSQDKEKIVAAHQESVARIEQAAGERLSAQIAAHAQTLAAAQQAHEAHIHALKMQLVDAEAAAAKHKIDGRRKSMPARVQRRFLAGRLLRSGLFDAEWYRAEYPDVTVKGLDAVKHYLDEGFCRGCRPNPFFDTRWYLDRYADVRRSGMNPLLHYLDHGSKEGRDPSLDFQTIFYLEANPDVRNKGINPLAHYLRHGRHEGRLPKTPVS